VLDVKLGKIVQIFPRDRSLYCNVCESKDRVHIHYALALPEVAKLYLRRVRSLPLKQSDKLKNNPSKLHFKFVNSSYIIFSSNVMLMVFDFVARPSLLLLSFLFVDCFFVISRSGAAIGTLYYFTIDRDCIAFFGVIIFYYVT
jgi:hypothetical protein